MEMCGVTVGSNVCEFLSREVLKKNKDIILGMVSGFLRMQDSLATFHLIHRDELCNGGQTLKSKALEFTEVELNSQLEMCRSQRQQESDQDVEDEDSKVRRQY